LRRYAGSQVVAKVLGVGRGASINLIQVAISPIPKGARHRRVLRATRGARTVLGQANYHEG
jgi:hypothetical protein